MVPLICIWYMCGRVIAIRILDKCNRIIIDLRSFRIYLHLVLFDLMCQGEVNEVMFVLQAEVGC